MWNVASTWDTSRYVGIFVSEATEHLEALSKELVELERGATPALLDSMFRHAHSLKGMSSSMGLDATATLAHQLEDVFAAVRSDLGRVDKTLGDLVLQAVDVLTAHVAAVSAQRPVTSTDAVLEPLSAWLIAPAKSPPPTTTVPAPVPTAPDRPSPIAAPAAPVEPPSDEPPVHPRFQIVLRVSPGSNQPGVRAFLAYKRLSLIGNVFDLKPPLEDVKLGRIPQGVVRLELETNEAEAAVTRTLKAVVDVELESITTVTRASTAAPAPSSATQPPAEAEAARLVGQNDATRTVRVRTEMLDQFLDAAGELMLATARVREVGKSLPDATKPALDEAVDRLHALVRDLHDKVMQARMTPMSVVTDRLPRAARDIARRRARDVELVITGTDIELDRAIVDELGDPVLHLLRNAIDHGIEPTEERRMRGKSPRGTVTFAVRRVRDRVSLEVSDDGRGMDPERLKATAVERGLMTPEQAKALTDKEALLLCCMPGLSTASDVTDVSGRGVGMDVVKRVVEALGGDVDIESKRGVGTTFRLTLPLTVAMLNVLLVGVRDDIFALPIGKVSGVVETSRGALEHSQDAPVLHFGQGVVPVHELGDVLGLASLGPPDPAHVAPFVVVDADDGRVALAVDALLGQQELVLKALAKPLDLVPGLAGVSILGTGRPVFVLDVARLVSPP
ncbi:MAG: chemotaxis protein CheA [Archangium sp.]|nr:chemotaxis protein CheA [Archangium sp.]